MTSYVKVFGQYLIKVLVKSLREVNLRQKSDMYSVFTTIEAKKGLIMSDENVVTLCTASNRCSVTAPSFF